MPGGRQLLGERVGLGAPQHRAQPGQQLARRERLGDVVVGAELEPDHAIGLVAARGQHDHRDAVAGVAQRAQHREPVEPGHHHVEQDRVEPAAGERGEPGLAAAGVDERHALRLEVVVEQLGEPRVVVDQQDPHVVILRQR